MFATPAGVRRAVPGARNPARGRAGGTGGYVAGGPKASALGESGQRGSGLAT